MSKSKPSLCTYCSLPLKGDCLIVHTAEAGMPEGQFHIFDGCYGKAVETIRSRKLHDDVETVVDAEKRA